MSEWWTKAKLSIPFDVYNFRESDANIKKQASCEIGQKHYKTIIILVDWWLLKYQPLQFEFSGVFCVISSRQRMLKRSKSMESNLLSDILWISKDDPNTFESRQHFPTNMNNIN